MEENPDLSILAVWTPDPYKQDNLAGHLFPFTLMGSGTFDDGAKFSLAWFPKDDNGETVLVVDVPDRRVVYKLSINALLRILEKVEDTEGD